MKETFARMVYEYHCQCRILRFEERAKECILMAMANLLPGQPKRKQHVRSSSSEARRIQVRGVTGVRPEAG